MGQVRIGVNMLLGHRTRQPAEVEFQNGLGLILTDPQGGGADSVHRSIWGEAHGTGLREHG